MNNMRKIERKRSADWALEVFRRAPFVTMSVVRPDGSPYGIPLSIVVADPSTFYFHCAAEGEKIDCIRSNSLVSLSAVSKCTPVFEHEKRNFTMHYRSAIALGRSEIVEDENEKIYALRLICERFLPRNMNEFDPAIKRSLSRTMIVRIDLTEPPIGKEKS